MSNERTQTTPADLSARNSFFAREKAKWQASLTRFAAEERKSAPVRNDAG
jgi:hypothetical protein